MDEQTASAAGALGGMIGGGAAATILAMVARWLAGREVKRLDDTLKDHRDRLAELEATVVGKPDLAELKGELRGMLEAQHRERLDEIRRIHERMDQAARDTTSQIFELMKAR